jgi:hypothetical protein
MPMKHYTLVLGKQFVLQLVALTSTTSTDMYSYSC